MKVSEPLDPELIGFELHIRRNIRIGLTIPFASPDKLLSVCMELGNKVILSLQDQRTRWIHTIIRL
jgi:hypothetical protein